MHGTIKLTRFTSIEQGGSLQAYPLCVKAEATGDMPEAVFVFQKKDANESLDVFNNVASPLDVFEIPEEPTSSEGEFANPFYRTPQLRLLLRTADEVERVWQLLVRDVESLVRSLHAENSMRVTAQVVIKTEDAGVVVEQQQSPSVRSFFLDHRPAGVAITDVDEEQIYAAISSPSPLLSGWLPLSALDDMSIAPDNAVFFYNLELHGSLKDALPAQNFELRLNGQPLEKGVTYELNDKGLFWLEYNPTTTTDPVVAAHASNAPWPLNYVDRDMPLATPLVYELILSV